MSFVITTVTRLPYAADEEPGMPSYAVEGSMNGIKFKVVSSIEIDGRDGEHDLEYGPQEWEVDTLNEDNTINEAYLEALYEHDEFNRLHEAATAEFYGTKD